MNLQTKNLFLLAQQAFCVDQKLLGSQKICCFPAIYNILDLPPIQDASHHQNYETLIARNLSIPLFGASAGWEGIDPKDGIDP